MEKNTHNFKGKLNMTDLNSDIQKLRAAWDVAKRRGYPQIAATIQRLANLLRDAEAEEAEKAQKKQGRLL
jgi:hypothetical protein